jgi:hypothetical protein
VNGDVVVVKLNGKDVYCDPAAGSAPFGLMTWEETGVAGLRLDKDGGTWLTVRSADDQQIVLQQGSAAASI